MSGESKAAFILLVEDNADDEKLTLRALKQSEIPNETVVARDGEEACGYLFPNGDERRQLPDLVLLDLKLPKVGGLEILQRMRREERTKNVPIVVLTSSDEERDIMMSYNLGANSYIRKPVDYVQFIDTIKLLGQYWLTANRRPA
ncbi:MAG: response regulator [Fimbriimonadaceae bacterium]